MDAANGESARHNLTAEEAEKSRLYKNLDEFFKAMEESKDIAVPAHTDASGREAMMHFAEAVNSQRNLCGQINLLDVRREEIKRCEIQTKRAPDVNKALTLKEVDELGAKFKNEAPNYAKSCEQGKEFFGPAVRMQVGCKTPKQDCQMIPFTGFPLSVNMSADGKTGTLEFVDGSGQTMNFDINSDGKGNALVKLPMEKKPVPLMLHQAAPCEVMRYAETPASAKKYLECHPITEYLKHQQAASVPPGKPGAPTAPGAK
jgi:hypothetical protein